MTEEQKSRLSFIAALFELMVKHDVTDYEDEEEGVKVIRPVVQRLPTPFVPHIQDSIPTQPPEAADDETRKRWGDPLQYPDG